MMTGYELIMLCARFDLGETKAAVKATLVALASFYNEERDGSWPGEKDLLPRAACDRRTLFKSVQRLEEVGLIFVERSNGRGNFYRFNIGLLSQGSIKNVTGSNNETSYKNDTGSNFVTSYKNATTPVTKMQPHQLQKCNWTSSKNVTEKEKKKEIKEKEKTSDVSFSSMTDSELIDFFSSVSHEEGIAAREEYTRRVAAFNKRTMRPDFEQPDRPQYEILGMHH